MRTQQISNYEVK